MSDQPVRRHPVHGVFQKPRQPTIVFVTVCTRNRQPWLADPAIHTLLRAVWKESGAWVVGRYVIMPDHLHLFASPGSPELPLENWVRYWKSQFSKRHQDPEHRWQTDHWDTRMRSREDYQKHWEYVRENPVRHGLSGAWNAWPYGGEIGQLEW